MDYIIIKCGGSVLERLPDSFYKKIVTLYKTGKCKPVIVHGGGPLISTLLTKLGVKTKFVDGLRVTSEEVLDVVEMVLSGSVNKKIVERIHKAGGRAFGISGVDGSLLQAAPVENADDIGYVGEVVHVNKKMIDSILELDQIPVISPVAIDETGQKYNVNGDVAAAAVAQALNGTLCFISDIPGIYQDINGTKHVIPKLTEDVARKLIKEEVITGGMIPKVKAAMDGLGKVEQVVILNGMDETSISSFLQGEAVGTKIIAGEVHHA